MEHVITMNEKSTMKQTVSDILLDISWANLSRRYFGKSRSWLYHKLDGISGNGGADDFSDSEKEELREALIDLSARIKIAADKI